MTYYPLLNKRIVVTRSEDQSENIISMLKEAGAKVLLVPTIKIAPVNLSPEDENLLASYHDYDFVIFTSINSVRFFFQRANIHDKASSKPSIISIGKKTAEVIKSFGFNVNFIPPKSTSKDLIDFLSNLEWKAKKVLIPTGNLSTNEIAVFLKSRGALVNRIIIYKTLPNDSIEEKIREEIILGHFDLIIFYSPSQVRNFLAIFGTETLKGKQIATIGPTTRKSVEQHGLKVTFTPEYSTNEDLLNRLIYGSNLDIENEKL
jgi:uroporphyrinogen-III synthase